MYKRREEREKREIFPHTQKLLPVEIRGQKSSINIQRNYYQSKSG